MKEVKVRKLLFAGLFFLSFGVLSAQVKYQQYLDDKVRWTYEFSTGGPGFSYHEFSEYTVKGDTLINSTNYWNVWKRTRATTNGIVHQSYRPEFGLRETPDKKFFRFIYTTQSEELMNDFNLQMGDTLQHDFNGTFLVDAIDTVEFGNQKRLFYRSTYPCGVIEGIGFVARNGSFNNRMLCFQNRQGIYPKNATAQSCGFSITTSIDEPNFPTTLHAYPNPAKSEITVELPHSLQATSLSFRWYSITGVMLNEGKLENRPLVTLPLHNYQNGLYILWIGDKNRWIPLRIMVIR